MLQKLPIFKFFFIISTIILAISLYDNHLNVVEPEYYSYWEKNYERVVVGRLAKSQQDGILSAGGLLGLANAFDGWNFDINEQYRIYENGVKVEAYEVYRSHPGHQGIIFSIFNNLTNFTPAQNITAIRLITTTLSAVVLGYISMWLAVEFGWLAAIFMILFSISSEWIILPASNAYWSLWAFYLPFAASLRLLSGADKDKVFSMKKIYGVVFATSLIKVLYTGFEMITTTIIMGAIPFLYYALTRKWGWEPFLKRLVILGIVLVSATTTGLVVLSLQIATNDGSLATAKEYIYDRLDRRAFGDPKNYRGPIAESMQVSRYTVLKMYLNINAFNTQTTLHPWQAFYWQLILLFAFFSLAFCVYYGLIGRKAFPLHGLGLLIATWFSIGAPLSWFVIFSPTSYIHTFLFPMAWQMPFTLLGFAFCGYVVQQLITPIKKARTS